MFRCNLPPAFLQNDQGLLHATAAMQRWNRHQIRVRKFTVEKTNLLQLLPGLNFHPFSHESGAVLAELSWLWNDCCMCGPVLCWMLCRIAVVCWVDQLFTVCFSRLQEVVHMSDHNCDSCHTKYRKQLNLHC